MKTRFLFPRQFRTIGWILFVPSFIVGIFTLSGLNFFIDEQTLNAKVFALFNQDFLGDPQVLVIIENSIADEILVAMIIIGGLLTVFSKVRQEDEMIAKIRYESLVWAAYLHFAVMLLATFFIYGLFYVPVMIANMFTLLLFFIIRFHIMLYKLNKSVADEE